VALKIILPEKVAATLMSPRIEKSIKFDTRYPNKNECSGSWFSKKNWVNHYKCQSKSLAPKIK